ncbi:hypothetical protein [Methanothrix soehngenii]
MIDKSVCHCALQFFNAILQRLDSFLDCLDYETLDLSIGQGDELL